MLLNVHVFINCVTRNRGEGRMTAVMSRWRPSENICRENINFSVLVCPGILGRPAFTQVCSRNVFLFTIIRRNLRQQQSVIDIVHHIQTVLSDFNFLIFSIFFMGVKTEIRYPAHRFPPNLLVQTRILERSCNGHILNSLIEGSVG